MTSKTEIIGSMGVCALDLFLFTCTMENVEPNDDIPQNKMDMTFNVVFNNNNNNKKNNNNNTFGMERELNLSPMQPSYKPRALVLCISRIFLFEKWQLLIACLEAYRLFKVDLVVAYVQSAILSVFELMRAYEKDGILKIRPGIRFPHHRGMKWNPNAETEFNGQILLAHECFYEHRESAKFIGLLDLDDLLVPSKNFPGLPAAFSAAFQLHPDTAYFLVNKIDSSFVEQNVSSPTEFSLRKLFTDGIRAAETYNAEKLVVRPKAVRGFWIHNAQNLEPNKRAVRLLTNYSLIFHLANDLKVDPEEFRNPFMANYDINIMNNHSTLLLKQFMNLQLPSAQPFFDALLQCHDQIISYTQSALVLGIHSSPHCLTYSLCEIPQLPTIVCATTRSIFGTKTISDVVDDANVPKVIIHIREKSVFDSAICSEENGI
ncbi:hypothetical protein niasHT_036035 [Heterodera trifolii]|uniref:Glycosyltransferase family 92 protein n=1 Tax=Heterodera trifolii TaxID=157864 RepID=A0ABD2I4I0_9BILA